MTWAAWKLSIGLCSTKGCTNPATRPCTCAPELCESCYVRELEDADAT